MSEVSRPGLRDSWPDTFGIVASRDSPRTRPLGDFERLCVPTTSALDEAINAHPGEERTPAGSPLAEPLRWWPDPATSSGGHAVICMRPLEQRLATHEPRCGRSAASQPYNPCGCGAQAPQLNHLSCLVSRVSCLVRFLMACRSQVQQNRPQGRFWIQA